MLILFDHGTPRGLARAFPQHTVFTARSRGWDRLNNSALLNAADEAEIDVLLTTDQRLRYQQNLTGRKIAIVVLTGTIKAMITATPTSTAPVPEPSTVLLLAGVLASLAPIGRKRGFRPRASGSLLVLYQYNYTAMDIALRR
jgi:hypothetical protein